MIFHPPRSTGLAFGLAGVALLAALDVLLVQLLRTLPLSFLTFILFCLLLASLPVAALLGYRSYALARARYVLSRNALLVEWGGRRLVVPMAMIREARLGADFEGELRPRGIVWPGNLVGRANVAPLGAVEFLAAAEKPALVLVKHPEGWLALSPGDPQVFLSFLTGLQAAGPEDVLELQSEVPAFRRWDLWRDRVALALVALGGLSALALLGYLLLVYPGLPSEIPLHFDAQGQPDSRGAPAGLLILPLMAGLAWAVNTLGGLWLYRRETERAGAYLLFAGAVAVQALVWVATIGLLMAGRSA